MDEHIALGRMNRLRVTRRSAPGLYLAAADGEEVLLPNRYIPKEGADEGKTIEVFVYTDSEGRRVATTLRPSAMLGEFALFEVVDTRHYGAFVAWGLPKDLFVPLSQQKTYFKKGDRYVLRVCLDEATGRLYASQRIGKFLTRPPKSVQRGDAFEVLILARTPLGYKVVVDNRYEGMLFANEVFETLRIGERRRAYVKRVRRDGKLDMRLQPLEKEAGDLDAQRRIVRYLGECGGRAPFTYKSSPEAISDTFGVSKKAFKRALTALLEAGHVALDEEGIRLTLSRP